MDTLLDGLLTTPEMAEAFSARARLQGMLDFEAGLARAQAILRLVPNEAAEAIAAACDASRLDLEHLGRAARTAGNPAIPMVRALTDLVADPEAARLVHQGATSQDAMDTGLVLQIRRGLDLLDEDLGRSVRALRELARTHRDTPMAGRTLLQQAVPVTFGLVVAGWLDAVARQRRRLRDLRPRVLVVQCGGAAGTLAAYGGLEVAAALARQLDLGLPDLPWHTARDRIAETGATLALLVGTLGKIMRDLSLLMQTEVAEAFEPAGEGRGGSSTMPHKRNPVAAAVVLAAATRAPGLAATLLAAMPQEHQRGLGGWHAEWETLPELFRLAAGALRHTAEVIEGLQVDPARMRANLDLTRGLTMAEAAMMALAPRQGRLEAHDRIEAACRRALAEGRHLREILAEDPETAALGDLLLDPAAHVGLAGALVDRVLAATDEGED
jgi:3-carboxy-cis,cis-muconate cycloisomerase